ncbi:hypothetical protein ACJZ2D_004090 [Fusarium nematophilum]
MLVCRAAARISASSDNSQVERLRRLPDQTAKKLIEIIVIVGQLNQTTAHALSQESADPDFLEDYDTFIPEWEVEVSPGGPTVALNGTIEEVHAELLKLNLSCDEDYLEPETDEEASELEKRTDCSGSKLMCFVNGYTWADSVAIKDGIIYLRKLKGRPINGAGLNASGRDNKPKKLASCGSIADGAAYIQKEPQEVISCVKRLYGGKGQP